MSNAKTIQFMLDGCDICFVAEAPEDITLKQLLKQCDRIEPHWCACGIRSAEKVSWIKDADAEIIIDYDSIKKTREDVNCDILGEFEVRA